MNKNAIMQERTDYEFWSGLNNKIPRECYFFNPQAFICHLDKVVTPAEFNPYIIDGSNYRCRPRINQNLGADPEYEFKTNLGFATAVTTPDNDKFLSELKYSIHGTDYYFATLNCPYKYSYAYNVYKNGIKQPHTGIDLPGWTTGFPNAPIISFINGTVWGIKWEKSYGNILLIKDKNSDFLYLLAHLEKINVEAGDPVLPGQIVALAGSTGTGGGESATNVHLHLEVFNVEGLFIQTVINENSNLIWNDSFDRFNHRRDPLNNTK